MGVRLYAWRPDGTPLAGFPVAVPGYVTFPIALADLNGDARLEVLAAVGYQTLYAYRSDGTLATDWPVETGYDMTAPPLVADLDMDDHLEVVVRPRRSSFSCRWDTSTAGGLARSPRPIARRGPCRSTTSGTPGSTERRSREPARLQEVAGEREVRPSSKSLKRPGGIIQVGHHVRPGLLERGPEHRDPLGDRVGKGRVVRGRHIHRVQFATCNPGSMRGRRAGRSRFRRPASPSGCRCSR